MDRLTDRLTDRPTWGHIELLSQLKTISLFDWANFYQKLYFGDRCTCHIVHVYGMQCCHEICISSIFHLKYFAIRWLNDETYNIQYPKKNTHCNTTIPDLNNNIIDITDEDISFSSSNKYTSGCNGLSNQKKSKDITFNKI